MANFFDISNWEERKWYNTGGTRNKAVFQNPDNDSLYYFKTSLLKQDKDYKYEFWSEIIASEIGDYFGFNVLKYDIAYNGIELGCMSKLMIDNDESLIEGYRYLTAFNPAYSSEDKKSYTFQFIFNALNAQQSSTAINDVIKIIVFDSIIGNSDRHQENWGFIQRLISTPPKSEFFKFKFKNTGLTNVVMDVRFAPIYDSGSCLGREIVDEKIKQYLTDETMIQAYIKRGKSEIHWHGNKINHFELIKNIMKEFEQVVIGEIERVKQRFDRNKIEDIVLGIDKEMPSSLLGQKIPEDRKKLIIKLITLRCEQLISIIQ